MASFEGSACKTLKQQKNNNNNNNNSTGDKRKDKKREGKTDLTFKTEKGEGEGNFLYMAIWGKFPT